MEAILRAIIKCLREHEAGHGGFAATDAAADHALGDPSPLSDDEMQLLLTASFLYFYANQQDAFAANSSALYDCIADSIKPTVTKDKFTGDLQLDNIIPLPG